MQRGRVTPSVRTKFQAVALLLREERARIRAAAGSESRRAEQLKRLEGIATILATSAVRDPGLLALLAEDAVVSDAARTLTRDMLRDAGIEPAIEVAPPPEPAAAPPASERAVLPQSVLSRQLANPFLAPDFSAAPKAAPRTGRLSGWELLGPLLNSFERAGGGDSACMPLPAPSPRRAPAGMELMPHQARLIAAAASGHRTFLLADEPGLGKTAQALLAAEAANAYPLLVVVPNVVKTNWAREAGLWTPHRSATVIHGNGETHRRLRRHRRRQLRGARPPRGLDRRLRLPRHGGRRGALHQEQDLAALAARPRALRAHPVPHRATPADGPDRHPADQRHRRLPGHLAVPRLDRRHQAPRRADGRARGHRSHARRPRLLRRRPPVRDRPRHRPAPQGRRRRRHPGPTHRRPPRRAGRSRRPVDPGGRAGPRPPDGGAVRDRAREPHVDAVRGDRPRPGAPGRPVRSSRTRPRRPARTCSA